MKKLISAVTSLCMAATMVSAVVPATVGAADATKGFSIKTYNPDKPGISDGSSKVTVTKDQLANGDYTFPAAVYLTEATNGGTGSFSLNLSTNSPDIKFNLKSPNQSYFDEKKTFTISSGEATTDCYISFGGKYGRLSGYEAAGRYVFGVDESQSKAGTDNYFLGLAWNNDGEKYSWAGTKSDDYPVYVFDVTVPKGTPAGTYDIDFLHYDTDDRADVTVMTPLVEAYRASDSDPAAKYSIEDNNLTLNKMTIEVQGDGPVATTTTTQVTPPVTTTTTTQVTPPVGNADFNFSIVDENGQSTAKVKAGQEVLVNVNVNAGSNTCAGMDAQFDLGGLDMTTVVNKSKALGNAKVKDNKTEGRISIIATDAGTTYKIDMVASELKIFKEGGSGDKYTGAWTPLTLTVGAPVTSTTTNVTTTTTTVTTTTTTVTEPQPTTTTTNPNPGTKLVPTWGDVNCDGSVNVADVVVLNRYLNNPTYPVSDQGKVNGDVLDPQDKTGAAVDPAGVRLTAADSETILKSIVELVTLPQ